MVWTALAVMAVATLANHLGLTEAVFRILPRIVRCSKCLSFWLTLAVLAWVGCDIVTAVVLSIFMAYLSLWFDILLFKFNEFYNAIWERIQSRKKT